VHRTAGRFAVRVFGAFSELLQFSGFELFSPQPPITRAVRRLLIGSRENTLQANGESWQHQAHQLRKSFVAEFF
jgi:hypothetical protein